MALKQTTRLTLVEQVSLQIEGLIESGEWPVGIRIPPEPELTQQLGVSRNTIREAVRALIHTGLLEARQGDGTYVRSTSELGAALQRRLRKSSVAETLEVRYALEQEAARLAALRRTSEDVNILSECLARRDASAEGDDLAAFVQADVELHQAVIAATHNNLLIDLYEHMSEAVRSSINGVQDAKIQCRAQHEAHHALVEAINQQDPIAAQEAARTYIGVSQALLQNENGGFFER